MITTYEQEGIKIGFNQGIEQGERASLVRLIEKKFGNIDEVRTRRILNEIDQDTIRSLQLAVLDASSLEDLGI